MNNDKKYKSSIAWDEIGLEAGLSPEQLEEVANGKEGEKVEITNLKDFAINDLVLKKGNLFEESEGESVHLYDTEGKDLGVVASGEQIKVVTKEAQKALKPLFTLNDLRPDHQGETLEYPYSLVLNDLNEEEIERVIKVLPQSDLSEYSLLNIEGDSSSGLPAFGMRRIVLDADVCVIEVWDIPYTSSSEEGATNGLVFFLADYSYAKYSFSKGKWYALNWVLPDEEEPMTINSAQALEDLFETQGSYEFSIEEVQPLPLNPEIGF